MVARHPKCSAFSFANRSSANCALGSLILFLLLIFFLLVPIVFAASTLDSINRSVCDRFEEDLNKMAAIMEELRSRKGIKETRVAYGGIDTPIKAADYQVTFAAEAVAFERDQKFASVSELRYNLEVLVGKVLAAKVAVGKVLDAN